MGVRTVKPSITHNCDPGHTPVGCLRVLSGRATAQCGLAGRRDIHFFLQILKDYLIERGAIQNFDNQTNNDY